MFRRGVRTHKASVEINMVSSFAAARTGALLAPDSSDAPPEVKRYRVLLRAVLAEGRGPEPEHPRSTTWCVTPSALRNATRRR